MQMKTLLSLGVIAVAALVAAFWINAERSPDTRIREHQPLIPGFETDINQVTRLRLRKGKDETVATLERGEHHWTLVEKGGYPADVGKVREMLLALANAVILEEKTSNPARYARLGVADVSAEDSDGVRVDMEGLAEPVSLIIGNYNPRAGDGTYVRFTDEAKSWLASGDLSVEKDTLQWLNRDIMDIPENRVQHVTIRHPDGETLTAVKDSPEQPHFEFLEIPAGRALTSEGAADPLGGVLAGLSLDDVIPVSELNPADRQGVDVTYRTFDGLVITARAFPVDDQRYAHFNATFAEDQARKFAPTRVPSDTAEETEDTGPAPAPPALDEPELTKRREAAEQLNARLAPWVFAIGSYKYDAMNQRGEALLKPLEEPEPTASNNPPAPAPGEIDTMTKQLDAILTPAEEGESSQDGVESETEAVGE